MGLDRSIGPADAGSGWLGSLKMDQRPPSYATDCPVKYNRVSLITQRTTHVNQHTWSVVALAL